MKDIAAHNETPLIVHLTSVHPADDPRIAARECLTVQAAGFRVMLVAPATARPQPGLPVVQVPKERSRLRRMIFTPWRVLAAALRLEASVYHLHDPELIPVGLVLKALGRKVVYDVHESFPNQVLSKTWIPGPVRPLVAGFARGLERVADRLFDAIVVANPTSSARFSEPVLVQNFPDLREFPLGEPRLTVGRPPPPLVAYVGTIGLEQGLWQMVEAMHLVADPDARLALAGHFPNSLLIEARKRPGWHRVDLLGRLSRREVGALLRRATLGLSVMHALPNHLENYPTKLFEYMASGIPAIVSDFPLWRDIVIGARCGLVVDPLDPRGLAVAIDQLIAERHLTSEMGANGRQAIEERYNWTTEGDRLVRTYRRLVG